MFVIDHRREFIVNKIASRIGSGMSLIIGAMAIFAGGQVLLGQLPDYYVIDWLPVYNFLMGVVSVLITAILLWKRHHLAKTATLATLGLHTLVMLVLRTAYSDVVAPDSLRAMTLRISVWVIISVLTFIPARGLTTAADD